MPKVLLAIVIPILDSLYNKIAVWLNDMGKSFEVVSNATHLNIVNEKKKLALNKLFGIFCRKLQIGVQL